MAKTRVTRGTDAELTTIRSQRKPGASKIAVESARFVELSADGIIIVDAAGEIMLANRAAHEMFGYDGDLVGKRVEDLLPTELRVRHMRYRDAFYNEPQLRPMGAGLQLRGARKDGTEFPAEVSLTPLESDGEMLVAAAITDITKRRATEEALERSAEELKRSNAELQQFAYVASHDLQEPLRMVGNYTQLLKRRYAGRLDSDADDFIEFAVEGAIRMQSLINDLLEFSRVNSRAREHRPVALTEVMEGVVFNLHAAIQESGATVKYAGLPAVSGDETQLVQLFQNLVGNAIKFRASASPTVEVSAQLVKGRWSISVRDNGIGISADQRDRVFVIFQRLHSREQYPGTGIGLALCKQIVQRHGGQIWIEGAQDGGSIFRFTLPVAVPKALSGSTPHFPGEAA